MDFFGSEYVELYQGLLAGAKLTEEVNFIRSYINTDTRILDLCCGHGRHSIALAQAGADVVGVDLNEEALVVAIDQSKTLGLQNVSFVKDDALNFLRRQSNEFNVALILCNSFGIFRTMDRTALELVHKALAPNGKIILEVSNRDCILRYWQPEFWFKGENDTFLLQKREFCLETSELTLHETRIIRGNTHDFSNTMRIYSLHEILDMVTAVGFQSLEVFGGYDRQSPTKNSNTFVIVATK